MQYAGHHKEIVFSAIHRQKKRITEINWIFDLSWRKFDVNEIGHYTRALFFMPSPPSTSPSPPPNWQRWTARKNCHSIAQSGRSSELSDWCRPTTFAMTWPSDQNLERKTQFHYIKAAIVSPNMMSLATRNIAHSFFNWMRQDNRARSPYLSCSHPLDVSTDWTCAHAFTHAWPWNRKLYLVCVAIKSSLKVSSHLFIYLLINTTYGLNARTFIIDLYGARERENVHCAMHSQARNQLT